MSEFAKSLEWQITNALVNGYATNEEIIKALEDELENMKSSEFEDDE